MKPLIKISTKIQNTLFQKIFISIVWWKWLQLKDKDFCG